MKQVPFNKHRVIEIHQMWKHHNYLKPCWCSLWNSLRPGSLPMVVMRPMYFFCIRWQAEVDTSFIDPIMKKAGTKIKVSWKFHASKAASITPKISKKFQNKKPHSRLWRFPLMIFGVWNFPMALKATIEVGWSKSRRNWPLEAPWMLNDL